MCTNQITSAAAAAGGGEESDRTQRKQAALVLQPCVGAQSVSQSQSPLVSLHVDIRVQAVRKKHLLRLYLSKGRADRHHQEGVRESKSTPDHPPSLSLPPRPPGSER